MTWAFRHNPAYTGEPRIIEAVCHDRSAFLTITCTGCGHDLHLHESQLPPTPAPIGARCPGCQAILDFPAGVIEGAFAGMRADGWIR